MTVRDLLQQTRDSLQDSDGAYWSDSELLNYYNSGLKSLAAERLEEPTTITVNLLDGVNEYIVNDVLRYISAKDNEGTKYTLYPDDESGEDDSKGIIVLDYNRIYVNTPVTDIALAVKHISIPANENLNSDVRAGDENALKCYMLSKAYEKESDMENFQKTTYFRDQYYREVNVVKKNSRVGYQAKAETTQGYFY